MTRVAKLEEVIHPQADGTFTLEEVCRALWRQDKETFLEIAKFTTYSLLIPQFEREEAEASTGRHFG